MLLSSSRCLRGSILGFGLGFFSLVMITTPATAEATRPLLLPPSQIRISKLAQPIALQDALDKSMTGLKVEDAEIRKVALAQASEYAQYRRSWTLAKAAQWAEKCARDLQTKSPSPYCALEKMRMPQLPGFLRFANETRADRHDLAQAIREGHFEKAANHSEADVTAAVGSIGDAASLAPTAKTIASGGCVPTALSLAFGAKMEELFPQPDAVELSKSLYAKSASCGSDGSAGKSAFRLGLILIWQKKYKEAQEQMMKAESIADISSLHARAHYWRYQCAAMMGDDPTKRAAQDLLLREHPLSFQNLAVNGDDETSMEKIVSNPEPQIVLRSSVRPEINPILRAAEALNEVGSPQLSAEILDRNTSEIATLEPEVRLYAAAFLNRIGYALPRFKILSSLFTDVPKMASLGSMRMLFPVTYLDIVRSKVASLDPYLILSLIRQESAFNRDARSSVGARGLMQLMPQTARHVAKVGARQLFEPSTNVRVGTKYFEQRLTQYGGDVELTLAAYNAGDARVENWLRRYPTDNKILFLDFIPFHETRDYVSSILRNYYWYTRLYSPENVAKATSTATGRSPASVLTRLSKIQAIMSANAGFAATTKTTVDASR